MRPFICPVCGGAEFSRDTGSIGGRLVALDDVRCNAPGCGWHGEWIDPASVSLLAERDALKAALVRVEGLINARWATPDTQDGRFGVEALNIARAALAQGGGK